MKCEYCGSDIQSHEEDCPVITLQPGPCVICGERNYALSVGGPGICPACDCGSNIPERQRKNIESLQKRLDISQGLIDDLMGALSTSVLETMKCNDLLFKIFEENAGLSNELPWDIYHELESHLIKAGYKHGAFRKEATDTTS